MAGIKEVAKFLEKHTSKVELANHKIDLALVDDLRKSENELKKLSVEANGNGLSQVRKAVLKADSSFADLLRASDNTIKIADKFINAAKELGVDSKEAQGIKNLAAALQNDAEYWLKELNASQYS